tara:strand:- start:1555 stop:1845 length:291 start_codon:yes stop_codon:yes gene_type:complete
MNITKKQLQHIVQEELTKVINEDGMVPYIAKSGDSPFSIAKSHGLPFDKESVAKLIQHNKDRFSNDISNLQVGQKVHIPGERTATKLGLANVKKDK